MKKMKPTLITTIIKTLIRIVIVGIGYKYA
jgi:hypothetical protein